MQSLALALVVEIDNIRSSFIALDSTVTTGGRSLLSVGEVAAALGVSSITVRRRIASGELPAVRVGRHGAVRVSEDALQQLVRPYGEHHHDDRENV